MENQDLTITIKAFDEATKTLKEITSNLDKNAKGMNNVQKSSESMATSVFKATAAYDLLKKGLSSAYGFLKSSVEEAVKAEEVQAQLNATLKSTGGEAGVTSQAAIELAQSMQKLTTYDDESVLSAENLLLTFTKIGSDIFPQVTEAVLDMSTAMGQDLKSSALQIGKALQDPIKGVTALTRVGVDFSGGQDEVIKKLVETGRTAEAQQLIMAELNKEFGGSAQAQAKTYAGQIQQLKNEFGDVKEEIGKDLLPDIKEFFTLISGNKSNIVNLASGLGDVASQLIKVGSFLGEHIEEVEAIIGAWVTFGVVTKSAAKLTALSASITGLTGLLKICGLEVTALTGKITLLKTTSVGALGVVGAVAAGAGILITNSVGKLNDVNEEVINIAATANEKAQQLAIAYNKVHKTALTAMDFGGQKTTMKTNWLGIPHAEVEIGTIDITKYREALKLLNAEQKKQSDGANKLSDGANKLSGGGGGSGDIPTLSDEIESLGKQYTDVTDKIDYSLEDIQASHSDALESIRNDITNTKAQLKDLAKTYREDLSNALDDYTDSTKSNKKSLAESVVANEEAIKSLQAQLVGGGLNKSEKQSIETELADRLGAEQENASVISSLSGEIAAVRAYNAMSALEQSIYNYQQEQALAEQSYQENVARITSEYNEKRKALKSELDDLKSKQSEENELYKKRKELLTSIQNEIDTTFATSLNTQAKQTKDSIAKQIEYYKSLAEAVSYAKTGNVSQVEKASTKLKSVNDAIITPKGDIISTHPKDWLMAMKDPSSLTMDGNNSSGNTIVVNINNPIVNDKESKASLKAQMEDVFRDIIRVNKVQF